MSWGFGVCTGFGLRGVEIYGAGAFLHLRFRLSVLQLAPPDLLGLISGSRKDPATSRGLHDQKSYAAACPRQTNLV